MASLKTGLFVRPTANVGRNLEIVQELDEAGVVTAWQTNNVLAPDPLTFYAAAAASTKRIRLGTSIMQVYPRHPAALVSQVQALEGLAPGRVRLGVGTSHRPSMEKNLGISMGRKPLTYLQEYVTVLRELLWEGRVDVHGEFFNVSAQYPENYQPPRTEISIAALSEKSYRTAGEITDAAISWVSPVPYLVRTALPALAEGAKRSGRSVPPLIAHVPVAVTTDRDLALEMAGNQLWHYGALPFYQKMFESAGVPATAEKRTSPEALDVLVASGTSDQIYQRLAAIISEGIGELLIHHIVVSDEDTERRELAKIITR
ncbi:MAG TPA: LLM class flavin-dependent oxidoreductase [Thermomicrobiales bacterium]|nr:LLM class flavin-dependent oxidoreductase [Thermomicrobiales bacterium]